MKTLILIPARTGSKGLPGKNVKVLGEKPLIAHTFAFAKQVCSQLDCICVSSNDDQVIELALKYNIIVPFKRPENLANDTAGMYEVIMHALDFYEDKDEKFDAVLLLQPTSPFRILEDYNKMFDMFDSDCDMIVSVKESKANPYFNLFEDIDDGYLQMSKPSDYKTRQECPKVYAYNGSMYLIKTESLRKSNIVGFKKIKKLLMPEERSVDIDTMIDWIVAEHYLRERN